MRKMLIKYKENKKFSRKKAKKYFILFLAITIMLISNLSNLKFSKSAEISENYSQYLTQSTLIISDDKCMLLQDIATSGTNYRNIFESNFLYPSALSNEMLNGYTSDYVSYNTFQSYFDNLDNIDNYGSNNNSKNTYQEIESQNLNVQNGIELENNNKSIYGDYNATHTFDLNYGITIPTVNIPYSKIVDFKNHTSVLYQFSNSTKTSVYNYDIINSKTSGKISFWYSFSNSYIAGWIEQIYFQNSSNNENFCLYSSNSKLYSYDFKTSVLLSNNINKWIYIELEFTPSFIKIYVNKELKQTTTQKAGWNNVDRFYIMTLTASGYYGKSYIDALDYNWSNGYYKYRNYYPLGSKVKRENYDISKEYNQYIIPNSNILSEWNIYDYTNINEYPSTDGYYDIVCTTSDENQYVQYGFSDLTINKQINKIRVNILVELYYFGYSSSDLIGYLFDGTNVIGSDNSLLYGNGLNNVWIYFEVSDINITNVNNLSVKLKAPSWFDYGHGLELDTIYLQLYYSELELDNEYETNIEYNNQNPIKFELFYSLQSNISNLCNISIFNYDLNEYILFESKNYYNDLNLYSIIFNDSGYFRLNKFKIAFNSTNTFDFIIIIDVLFVQITYVIQEFNGYQYFSFKFNEHDLSDNNLGYYQFQIKIYNDYIQYRYLEVSTSDIDYDFGWIMYNLTLNNISLSTLEIIGSIRYGYNTLVQTITNTRYEIYFNNQETNLTIIEQNRKGSYSGHKYNSEFNYSSYNNNYLNITGIYGNYSYSCLKGIRCLKGQENQVYNRWFKIPKFYEIISITIFYNPSIEITQENEPNLPSNYYWTYETFRLINGITFDTTVGNWTIAFTPVKVEKYTAKHPYFPKVFKESDFGSWTFRITDDIKISFNFIRDAICWLINSFLLLLQWFWYFLVSSFSYLFMFLGCYILFFLFNIVVYAIFIGICWVGWYIIELLILCLQGLIWLWTYIIYPILIWMYQNLLPVIIEAIIMILAFCITCFIYVMTLGNIDFWSTYYMVVDILNQIVDLIIDWIMVFANNMLYILIFILWYLINAGLIYFRYLYSRARGNINRAEQLYYTFQIYIAPIVFIWNLLKKLLESTPVA